MLRFTNIYCRFHVLLKTADIGILQQFQYLVRVVNVYVLCVILSVGVVHIKDPLLLIGKSSPCSDGSGFLSRYLNGPLLFV